MNRRFFLRAAPAAAALAPSVVQAAAQDTSAPVGGRYIGESVASGSELDWRAERIAELRNRIAGKRSEREKYAGAATSVDVAASVDALRSVSQVNKHRMARERNYAAHVEQNRWYAQFELADLLKQMVR